MICFGTDTKKLYENSTITRTDLELSEIKMKKELEIIRMTMENRIDSVMIRMKFDLKKDIADIDVKYYKDTCNLKNELSLIRKDFQVHELETK